MYIRDMKESDLERVLEIERKSFPTPWPKDQFEFEIKNNPLARYIVVEDKGKLVGYGGIWVIVDEAHVTTIAVDPEYRGLRAGDKLMDHLIYLAKDHMNLRAMTLEVRKNNFVAQGLYEKYGFKNVGERPGYYTDTNEDAIIMWKEFR